MASTYVNDLRLNEMATGDASGSWGTVTNTNLELIAEAFSFGTEGITTNADTHTTTIADGATDPGRSMFLKYTGTLDSACTITIAPNTISKLWFIENGTSGSQNIIIKQGSGATITIPPGDTKAIYSDGAGSGGKMVDAFASLSVVDLNVSGNLDVDGTANLDAVDIDGAVNMATTALVTGVLTTTASAVFNGGFTSNGDTVTFASANSNDPNIIIKNTTNDANAPIMDFITDKGAAGADNDALGLIRFTGDNDAQEQITFARVLAEVADASDGAEGGSLKLQLATHDGEIQTGLLLVDGSAEDEVDVTIGNGAASVTTIAGTLTIPSDILHAGDTDTLLQFDNNDSFRIITGDQVRLGCVNTEVVINENSVDMDFRVESDGNTHMLFVDGGNDYVLIGSSSGDIGGSADGVRLNTNGSILSGTSETGAISTNFYGDRRGTNNVGIVYSLALGGYYKSSIGVLGQNNGSNNGGIVFSTIQNNNAVNERMRISPTEITINEEGDNQDFRVESDATTHMFFVDASAEAVIIGAATEATSDSGLSVVGSSIDNISIQYLGTSGGHESKFSFVDKRGQVNAQIKNQLIDDGAGTAAASLLFASGVGGTASNRLLIGGGTQVEAVFNEPGFDYDFRVESDVLTHMLAVDASANTVQIGTTLTFGGSLNVKSGGIGVGESGDAGSYRRFYWNTSNNDVRFWNGTNEAIINSSGAFVDASDVRLKKDIADIEYGINTVKSLKPRKYKLKSSDVEQVGFVAQEMELHVPEIVTTGINPDNVEQKGIAYGQLTAVLTKAIQEQQTVIEALTARITALENA
jgi:hypothetical protein